MPGPVLQLPRARALVLVLALALATTTVPPVPVRAATDGVAPSVTAPTVSLRSGVAMSGSSIRARVSWSGADNRGGSGLARFDLDKSTDGGTTWAPVTRSLTRPINVLLATTGTVQFRVRARDVAGNVGSWAYGATLLPRLIQQSNSLAWYRKTWTAVSSTSYSGGSARYSRTSGASASVALWVRSIALVTTTASTRGKAKVYVDGTLKATVDTYSATSRYRVQKWAINWSTVDWHTLKVVVAGTLGRPRVDVDAFAVLLGPAPDRVVDKPGELYRFQLDEYSADYNGMAQTMTVGRTGWLHVVDLPLSRDSWTTADLGIEIRSGDPTGAVLTTASIQASLIPAHPYWGWISTWLDEPVFLHAGDTIAITTSIPNPLPTGDPAGPAWYWAWNTAAYSGGVAWGGSGAGGLHWGAWSDGSDLAFRTWVAPEVAPRVFAFNVAPGAVVSVRPTFQVTFNEEVTAAADAFTLACTGAGLRSVTAEPHTGGGVWSVTPVADLSPSDTCVLKVAAAGVHDLDTADPPDTMASDASLLVTVAP
ncbi:MAG TPA: Ig-like domain-containing protein [Candidatus Limnocylindrales bacterium]|nr:Ig-like domain-containing protein [Candidatus Limnocylindrales bacterium]